MPITFPSSKMQQNFPPQKTPSESKHQREPQIVETTWKNISDWGFFGSQRRIEIVLDSNSNKIKTIQAVTQSFWGRLASLLGIGDNYGRETPIPISTDLTTKEILEKSFQKLGKINCREILSRIIGPNIKRNPEEIEKTINQSIANQFKQYLTLRSKADDFGTHLEHFSNQIEDEWRTFTREKLTHLPDNISNLDKEITAKQKEIFEICRDNILEEIQEGVVSKDAETPPIRERYRRFQTSGRDKGIDALIENRKKVWANIQEQLSSEQNGSQFYVETIEHLDNEMGTIIDESIIDDLLIQLLKNHASEGLEGCSKEAQKQAKNFLLQLSPALEKDFTLEFLFDRHEFYKNPANTATLTEKQKDILEDFNAYVKCIKHMQEAAKAPDASKVHEAAKASDGSKAQKGTKTVKEPPQEIPVKIEPDKVEAEIPSHPTEKVLPKDSISTATLTKFKTILEQHGFTLFTELLKNQKLALKNAESYIKALNELTIKALNELTIAQSEDLEPGHLTQFLENSKKQNEELSLRSHQLENVEKYIEKLDELRIAQLEKLDPSHLVQFLENSRTFNKKMEDILSDAILIREYSFRDDLDLLKDPSIIVPIACLDNSIKNATNLMAGLRQVFPEDIDEDLEANKLSLVELQEKVRTLKTKAKDKDDIRDIKNLEAAVQCIEFFSKATLEYIQKRNVRFQENLNNLFFSNLAIELDKDLIDTLKTDPKISFKNLNEIPSLEYINGMQQRVMKKQKDQLEEREALSSLTSSLSLQEKTDQMSLNILPALILKNLNLLDTAEINLAAKQKEVQQNEKVVKKEIILESYKKAREIDKILKQVKEEPKKNGSQELDTFKIKLASHIQNLENAHDHIEELDAQKLINLRKIGMDLATQYKSLLLPKTPPQEKS